MARSLEQTVAMLRARKSLGLADRRRRIPRQKPPAQIENDYYKYLRNIVEQTIASLRPLLAELPSLMESAARERADSERLDAGEGKRVRELIERARARMNAAVPTDELDDIAERLAQRVSSHNREQLGKQIRAALGTDVFTDDPRLRALVDGFASENVALIKNVPEKLIAEIEQATTRAIAEAKPHRELAKDLETRFGYHRKRARLIARDQVGKLYGQINAERQKSIGVERFIWRTVGDIRVRGTPGGPFANAEPSHYDREGEIYEYDDPPDGELPGVPILCRCYPEPVFDDILRKV